MMVFTILTAAPQAVNTWFHSPGSVLLELGPLTIRWYGLTTALGFLAALYVMHKLASHCDDGNVIASEAKQSIMHSPTAAQKRDVSHVSADIDNFALVGLILGLVGARLWFVILNASYFSNHPAEIIQIWLGGQSIQGGLIGGCIGTWLYDCILCKNSWDSYLQKLSLIAITLPLAQAIGRWGNFFNEEAYGTVTNVPWGLYISHTGQLHHPTFLYESLANLVIFCVLLKLYPRLQSLQIIGAYFALYSALRIVLESMRTDSLMLAGMPAATLLSYIGLLVGFCLIIYKKPKSITKP